MPWVRKQPHSARGNWIVGIVVGAVLGLLLGYERWGSTAAVVSVVEKELTATESHIQELENRLSHLEAQLDANRSHRVAGAETSRGIKIAGEPTNLFVKGAFEAVQRKGDTY